MQKWRESLRNRHVYIAIIVLGVLLYGKSVFFDYTYVDDITIVEVNGEVLKHLSNLPKVFTSNLLLTVPNPHIYYRPLVNLLFMAEMQLTDNVLPVCHCTNILLHLLNCCLLYFLLLKFDVSKTHSGILSLIFCVLPIHASAIVWIPGRNDTFVTFFILLAFISLLDYAKTSRPVMLGRYAVFYFLGLLTKEIAVVLPILCLFELIFLKHERWNSKKVISVALCSGACIVLWLALRSLVHPQAFMQQPHYALMESLMTGMGAVVLYVGKVFLPLNLTVMPNINDQSLLYGYLSLLAIVLIIVIRGKKECLNILFGALWFVLFLLPAFLVSATFFEFRAYCSVVGIVLCIGRVLPSDNGRYRNVYSIGAVLILLFFAAVTWKTEDQYRDRMSYAKEAFLHAPDADDPYSILGGAYIDQGQSAAAEKVLLAGIQKRPSISTVHRMLGDVYAKRGDVLHAAQEYKISLQREPLHLYAYINYGKLCLQTGAYDQAVQLWKTSVAINPEFILGYYYLANYYIHTKGDPDSAMFFIREIQDHGSVVMPDLLEAVEALKTRRE